MNVHTPTPWTRDDYNDLTGSNGKKVVFGGGGIAFGGGDPERYANTEFMIHAVNSHADLVAALEAALKTAEFEKHPFRPWHAEARAALSRAKG